MTAHRSKAERDRLVLENLKLAHWFAARVTRAALRFHGAQHADSEDIASEAVVGLIQAAESWIDDGRPFGRYASIVIRNQLSSRSFVPGAAVTVGRHDMTQAHKFREAMGSIAKESPDLDDAAVFAAAAERLDVDPDTMRDRLAAVYRPPASFDAPLVDGSPFALGDTIASTDERPDVAAQRAADLKTVVEVLCAYMRTPMHPTSRAALWGWFTGEQTVVTAARIGVTKQAIDQKRRSHLPKIRQHLQSKLGDSWTEVLRP